MLRFIFTRILQALPVIFVVITATFFLVRSAGGPFDQESRHSRGQEGPRSPVLPRFTPTRSSTSLIWAISHRATAPSFKYPGPKRQRILFAGLPVTTSLACMR